MVVIRSITFALLLAIVTAAPSRIPETSILDTLSESEPQDQEDGITLSKIVDQLKKVTDQQRQAGFNPDFKNIVGNVLQLFKGANPSRSLQNENNQLTGSTDISLDKLKSFVDERRRIKLSLTLFKKYLEPLLDTELTKVQCNELILRYSKIHNLHSNFEEVQNNIELLDENEVEQINEREEIENIYFSSVAHAQQMLQNCELKSSSPATNLESSASSSSLSKPLVDNQVAFSAFAAGQSLLNTAFNFNFNLLNSQENGVVRDRLAGLAELIPSLD